MNSGFYAPAFRMIRGQVAQMRSITENLANSATPGYRRMLVDSKPFDMVLGRALRKDEMNWATGEKFDHVVVDFTQGPFQTTDRPLDCAIEGDGFFVVQNQNDGSEYYTRTGRFKFAPDGQLINMDGFPVMGENGSIRVPPGTALREVSIDRQATLYVGDRAIGRLQIVRFPNTALLERTGTTLFAAPQGVNPEPVTGNGVTYGGTIEGSNTSVMNEMAALIQCTRAYEACQRMIKAHDQTQQRLVQQASK